MLHKSPVACLCAVPEAVDGPQQLCLFLRQGLTRPALHLQHFVPFQLTDHHLAKVGKHSAGVRVKGARLVVNDAPAQVAKAQSIRCCSRYNANAMHCNKFVQQPNAGSSTHREPRRIPSDAISGAPAARREESVSAVTSSFCCLNTHVTVVMCIPLTSIEADVREPQYERVVPEPDIH